MSPSLGGAASLAARIGPNAVTRLAEALPPLVGGALTREVFDAAGLLAYLRTPPQQMVGEAEVARLHQAARALLGAQIAGRAARRAGELTADYLLAHRIPAPAQALLKRLPAAWAARLLLKAVSRHAWTFCGSGQFEARAGRPVVLEIRDNPLCRGLRSDAPACEFYAATFERLFRVLVHPATQVRETHCEARGDPCCRFELSWTVIKSDCKKRARLNAMRYLLNRLPYTRKDLGTVGAVDPLIVGRPSLVPSSGGEDQLDTGNNG